MRYFLPLLLLLIFSAFRVYTVCTKEECIKKEYTPEQGKKSYWLFEEIRSKSIEVTRRYLPSPHSELLLGMLIGIDELSKIPRFKDALKVTGTIHVVVVSGFNISLIFGLAIKVFGSQYKLKNMLLAQLVTLFYALLSGFEPPVIRAWVMGSIAVWAKYCGRSVDGLRLLLFSGLVMVFVDPKFLFSLSFQLSFLATLGLISFGNTFTGFFQKVLNSKSFVTEDLSATLSAQVLVWPLISYHFGTFSVISPIVNCLILWTVPIATSLGMVFLALGLINRALGILSSLFIYPFLDLFVKAVLFFSKFSFSNTKLEVNLTHLLLYYLTLVFLVVIKGKKHAD